MKNTLKYLIALLVSIAMTSCYEGIDPITEVDPGPDATAPVVIIKSPTEGSKIKVFEEVTSFNVKIEVTDDIEIASISIRLDGSEIKSYSSFIDYRRALEEYTYSSLVDGNHVLSVVATDIDGKSTTAEVNFSKEPPYIPMFDGEILYMPFDGDYRDLISFYIADEVGSPGFAGEGYASSNAYKGTTDSYLTLPSEGLQSNEFTAAFWYKVNADPLAAGLLVVGDDETDRKQGFRFFREKDGLTGLQRFKLNVGTGTDESWNNGGLLDPASDEWVHIAFTISQTETKIYFNGVEMNSSTMGNPIDWTGVGPLTIGSGGDTFAYWGHKSDNNPMDELRIFNKALTQSEIQIMINAFNPYIPQYDGESFYMPFDTGYVNLVSNAAATEVGTPSITDDSYVGDGAYSGAPDSYLTYPAANLLSSQFSATFWYKIDPSPSNAGILVISDDEDRNQGFRLFREGSPTTMRIKLNVGTGSGESWNDGDVIDATADQWVHIAMTISDDKNTIYINGVEVRSSDMSAPIDWTGCEEFVIGSGEPTFTYWNHFSDNSIIDDLRFFNKALTAGEVAAIVSGDYVPPYFGATMYMPFDGTNVDKVSNTDPTIVGTPGFAGESVVGSDAYAGATDSYLTFPIANLFTDEFSGAFWYKMDLGSTDRAGILTVSPPMNGADNDLSAGFRLFREKDGVTGKQRVKLHVGAVEDNVWNDGDLLDPASSEWVHIAFTVSATETKIYFNGEPVANMGSMKDKTMNWANCGDLSIGSGQPNFIGWSHLADLSELDELYLFDRVITPEEIQAIMAQ